MPTEITAFKAKDGSLHEDACSAATRDVEIMVQKSPLNENGPYAKKLVEWLTGNPREIRDTLEALEKACPKTAAEKAPSESSDRTLICYMCGTAEDKPHNFRHVAYYIPASVYYSDGNFYNTAGTGLGNDFHAQWRDRAQSFPKSREDAQALVRKGIRKLGDE